MWEAIKFALYLDVIAWIIKPKHSRTVMALADRVTERRTRRADEDAGLSILDPEK